MTYPPSPYGQQPPSPYGQPVQPYGAPSPYGFPQQEPPKKKSNTLLFVLLGVVALLVVVCGGGALYWWSQRGNEDSSNAHGGSGSSHSVASTAAKEPLTSRSADELLAVLPKQADLPQGWTLDQIRGERDDSKNLFDSAWSPNQCEAPFNFEDLMTVGSIDVYDAGENASGDEMAITIAKWAHGSKISTLESYISTCGSFTKTNTYKDGSEVDINYLHDVKVDPPKADVDAAGGYEEQGSTTATFSDGRPQVNDVFDPDDYYSADLRGLNVWFYCGNVSHTKDKCRTLFTDVVNKLNAL